MFKVALRKIMNYSEEFLFVVVDEGEQVQMRFSLCFG